MNEDEQFQFIPVREEVYYHLNGQDVKVGGYINSTNGFYYKLIGVSEDGSEIQYQRSVGIYGWDWTMTPAPGSSIETVSASDFSKKVLRTDNDISSANDVLIKHDVFEVIDVYSGSYEIEQGKDPQFVYLNDGNSTGLYKITSMTSDKITIECVSNPLYSYDKLNKSIVLTPQEFSSMFGSESCTVSKVSSNEEIVENETEKIPEEEQVLDETEEVPQEIEEFLAPTEEGEDKPTRGYQLSEYRELTIEEISSNYSINRIINDRNPSNYDENVLYVPLIDINYSSLISQLIENYELDRDNINKQSTDIIDIVKKTGKPFDNESYNNKISNVETIINNYYKMITQCSEDEVKSIIKKYNTALVEIKEGVKLSLLLKRARELNGKVIPGTKEYKQNNLPADAPFILSDTKKDFYKIKCYQDYSVKIYSFVEKNTSNEMEYLFEIANIPLPYHKDKIQLT